MARKKQKVPLRRAPDGSWSLRPLDESLFAQDVEEEQSNDQPKRKRVRREVKVVDSVELDLPAIPPASSVAELIYGVVDSRPASNQSGEDVSDGTQGTAAEPALLRVRVARSAAEADGSVLEIAWTPPWAADGEGQEHEEHVVRYCRYIAFTRIISAWLGSGTGLHKGSSHQQDSASVLCASGRGIFV